MHWLLCRQRNAWTATEWWCAPQRSEERDAVSMQREQHYYPLSLTSHARTHILSCARGSTHKPITFTIPNSVIPVIFFAWTHQQACVCEINVSVQTINMLCTFLTFSRYFHLPTVCLMAARRSSSLSINRLCAKPIFLGRFTSTGFNAYRLL